MKQQLEEFNIGKRHLANMMGKDPEFFTQADIDVLIIILKKNVKILHISMFFHPGSHSLLVSLWTVRP